MTTSAKVEAPSARVYAPWPSFGDEEIAAVERVLRSGKVNYWTGEEGRLFEQEFAAMAGCRFGVALANGTLALELALRALRIGNGDEVITTSRTYIASASCVAMVGATPVLVDVDRTSQNLTAETIASSITPRTRAIIAVHLNGWPCDMDPILDLARRHNLTVIEDCSQAHGATYKGRPVGSMGVMAAFSCCQDKIVTTGGEGGVLTTDNAALYEAVWSLKDHGKSFARASGERPGVERLYGSFGTNARMTEMQAAIGRVQLRRLPVWLAARRRNAATLRECLAAFPGLRLTGPDAEYEHSYYRYSVFVEPSRLRPGWTRDRMVEQLVQRGVPCYSWANSELHREKAFAGLHASSSAASLSPVARELSETSILFLVHPSLTDADISHICQVAAGVMAEATP